MIAARLLMVTSAGIILLLGSLHFFYTFYGSKLAPRDRALRQRMETVSLVISTQTDMWRAWVGFNASHSMGAIFFGLLFIHLAWFQPQVLFGSLFLPGLGLAVLAVYFLLGWKYWFRVPWAGISAALVLFAASLLAAGWPIRA